MSVRKRSFGSSTARPRSASSCARGRSPSRNSVTSASAVSGASFDRAIAGCSRVGRDALHLARDGRKIGEPPGRPRRLEAALERRLQLDGAQEQLPPERFASRPSALRPATSSAAAASRRELGGHGAVELSEQRGRLVEVVRANLHELLGAALLEPVGEAPVQRCPGVLREPRVGDIANQDVLEAERLLARDRRAVLARDEIPLEQLVERGVHAVVAARASPRRLPRTRGRSTAARWTMDFVARSSRSMRAAISACTVSGSGLRVIAATLERACASSPRRKSGLPSAFSSTAARCARGQLPVGEQCVEQAALSSGFSGWSSIVAARSRPPPQLGRTSSSSGRARQRINNGTSRARSASCSIRSSRALPPSGCPRSTERGAGPPQARSPTRERPR